MKVGAAPALTQAAAVRACAWDEPAFAAIGQEAPLQPACVPPNSRTADVPNAQIERVVDYTDTELRAAFDRLGLLDDWPF